MVDEPSLDSSFVPLHRHPIIPSPRHPIKLPCVRQRCSDQEFRNSSVADTGTGRYGLRHAQPISALCLVVGAGDHHPLRARFLAGRLGLGTGDRRGGHDYGRRRRDFSNRTDCKSRPDWFDVWRMIGASGDVPVSKDRDFRLRQRRGAYRSDVHPGLQRHWMVRSPIVA